MAEGMEDLREETERWLGRIEEEIEKVRPKGDSKGFLKNIRAYIKDSRYFMERGDLIRSFEAVIWAWAYLSIGREIGVLDVIPTGNI